MKSKGIGFFGLLAVVFITLKLAQIGAVAAWSWWWVLAPLWLPTVFVIGLFIVLPVVSLLLLGGAAKFVGSLKK